MLPRMSDQPPQAPWTPQRAPLSPGLKVLIAVASVVVAIMVVVIIVGAVSGGSDDAKAEPDPFSTTEVQKAADDHCDDVVQSYWINRRGTVGLPANVSAGWLVTAQGPIPNAPASSWRLSATYRLPIDREGRSRTQVFYCDVEWDGSEYSARLVK